jgi:hypothetical protein
LKIKKEPFKKFAKAAGKIALPIGGINLICPGKNYIQVFLNKPTILS